MKRWRVRDGYEQWDMCVYAASAIEAMEHARESVTWESYGDNASEEGSFALRLTVVSEDEDEDGCPVEELTEMIVTNPPEPKCWEGSEHDWHDAPDRCRENIPDPISLSIDVCLLCASRREEGIRTSDWGEQYTCIRYHQPSDASRRYADNRLIETADVELDGEKVTGGRYRYYDSATGSYWLCDMDDVLELGRRLTRGTEPGDCYSRWCQDIDAEKQELGDR